MQPFKRLCLKGFFLAFIPYSGGCSTLFAWHRNSYDKKSIPGRAGTEIINAKARNYRLKGDFTDEKKILISIPSIFISICLCAAVLAGHHSHRTPQKVGILLVAFGSSQPGAQISFENIDNNTRAAYPGIPVRWAYTSHIIRKKLAKQGKHLDSPEVALAKMQDEGFTHVVVQSLHTIGGAEYHDLRRTVGGFQRILLGYPLLATQEDMQLAVAAILKTIPKHRQKGDAVVLMGHGTHHPSNAFYAALMWQLQLKDPNIFVGTWRVTLRLTTSGKYYSKRKSKKCI